MPTCWTTFLTKGVSDHCLAKLALLETQVGKRKSFKYCNFWSAHPSFQDIVEAGWTTQIMVYTMLRVVKKLKFLKKDLKMLHSRHYRGIITEVEAARDDLAIMQGRLQQNPLDTQAQIEERVAFKQFRQLSALAESFLLQRSKATWIRLGDDNTKYFFSLIKQRILMHAVTQLQDENQIVQTNPDKVADIFVNFYQQLLGDTGGPRLKSHAGCYLEGHRLTIEEQLLLLQDFTGKEVKEAMFSINENKSPGPDSYGSGFYKAT
ncbi:uncharacterized protein LOC132639959 [Lycium barbarum]|uniref:uncharacterized protein LOC132639959 n=1 Tax=Lycium barbarum TaxID=112863 RepID=UPI00293F1F72|nr:uncharacterized protein LOC132639959 [Lycium barbarum]